MPQPFVAAFAWTLGTLAVTTALCHVMPRLGAPGRAIAAWMCRAPGLDLLVTIFTVLPLFVGGGVWGWKGLLGGLSGQYAWLIIWTLLHELRHWGKRAGPKIYKVNHRMVGTTRNILAVYITSFATSTFWVVRMTELLVYPVVAWLVKMPMYNHREWINVTRQKYEGLVGHDLIWCLYCDWMTGVWSLGSEMLRNIESFWCPIQFGDKTKCENCALDFPDVKSAWARNPGTIADAVATLEREYLDEPKPPTNAWFGHPVRLTVKGRPADKTNDQG